MFWSRAGVAQALTLEGQTLPYQRGGMGDHMAGLAAAGGVAAALLERTKTGRGQVVATSLVRIGSYMISWDLNLALRFGLPTVATDRAAPPNPLISNYRCSDGRELWLLGLEGDRHWPGLLEAIGKEEWADDPRFATLFDRATNAAALVDELDAVFATRTRAEWAIALDDHEVWWAPVQHVHELPADEQARAAGCYVEVPLPDGGSCDMPATPVTFARRPTQPARAVPEFGQQTEEVLLDLGHDWDHIIELKDLGAIL
jgi:crotonobetainyl-CoA:carnitine CoA-transferase CaiB-like acyl-CoA transferase